MSGGSSPSLAAPWLLRARRIRLPLPLRRRCYARLATSQAQRRATSRSFTSRAPPSRRIAAPPAHARLCTVITSVRRRHTPAAPTRCPACSSPHSAAGPSRSSAPRAPARSSARPTTTLGSAILHVLPVPWLGLTHVCTAKSRACSSTPAPRPLIHANILRTPSPAHAPPLASHSRPPCCHRSPTASPSSAPPEPCTPGLACPHREPPAPRALHAGPPPCALAHAALGARYSTPTPSEPYPRASACCRLPLGPFAPARRSRSAPLALRAASPPRAPPGATRSARAAALRTGLAPTPRPADPRRATRVRAPPARHRLPRPEPAAARPASGSPPLARPRAHALPRVRRARAEPPHVRCAAAQHPSRLALLYAAAPVPDLHRVEEGRERERGREGVDKVGS
jgi:hypothetical protein